MTRISIRSNRGGESAPGIQNYPGEGSNHMQLQVTQGALLSSRAAPRANIHPLPRIPPHRSTRDPPNTRAQSERSNERRAPFQTFCGGLVLLRRRPTRDRPKASAQGERQTNVRTSAAHNFEHFAMAQSFYATDLRATVRKRASTPRAPQINFEKSAMVLSFSALEKTCANYHPLPRIPPRRSTRDPPNTRAQSERSNERRAPFQTFRDGPVLLRHRPTRDRPKLPMGPRNV